MRTAGRGSFPATRPVLGAVHVLCESDHRLPRYLVAHEHVRMFNKDNDCCHPLLPEPADVCLIRDAVSVFPTGPDSRLRARAVLANVGHSAAARSRRNVCVPEATRGHAV